MNKNISRNPFVALCNYASRNNWCWKLFCTTCGHGAFKVAFSKIIHDQHPDDDSFWPRGKSNSDPLQEVDGYRDFWGEASVANQIKFASIIAEAKLSEIQSVVKFPDWLGYIGLVIHHCPSHEARKIISDALTPRFVSMLKDNTSLRKYFEEKLSGGALLSINDLSRIEAGKADLENPPLPLITDIL